ncbi:type II secretion system protein [Chitinimonas arctica]|uniref:Type II secretion system protein n=1 Tax=Chitinimonas arctica TaxID=2594795 RepID=A0A516SGF9_9NEIS|nr:type II secretion system protein [Chitinimonas arctica]QDQ27246.1 type II secretion system protein [Chitinimonas arctica]
MRRSGKRTGGGFAMIEVLVALVLVTSVGVAIVMWAESGLHSIGRLRLEYERMRAVRMAQDWIRALPEDSKQLKGEAKLGSWKISWERKLISQSAQNGYPRGLGIHDALLYQYQYQVFQADERRPWFSDDAVVLLSRQARTYKAPFQ